jgi:large conductance mechanosensitive channel
MAKEKGFFAEFKKFITRGNVLDMAVGVIIGGAFTAIVNAVSNNILKPIINWVLAMLIGKDGLTGAVTFLSKVYVLGEDGVPVVDEFNNQVVDLANSIYIDWGAFISAVINFLLIAFVLFVIVRTMNKVAAARAEAIEGLDLNEKRAIRQIRKEQKVSKLAACAIYLERLEEAKAAKA